MKKVRILFMPAIDVGNTNAQSLNAREIVLRLDPDRLESTVWYETEPDPRLHDRPGVRLLPMPAARQTPRILREQLAGYDVIAYMDCSPASYVFLHLPYLLRGRTKTVFHAEGPVHLENATPTEKFLYRGVMPRCSVRTAITDFVARDLERKHVRASYILPVGVDLCLFSPPVSRRHQVPTVLFVGALVERKGVPDVLQAAEQFPDVRFRLVGSGRHGSDGVLQRSIDERGLRNVTLEGSKTQCEILEIMRESDLLLAPSRIEGMPKVTLEAAATGLPCIVFNTYQTPSVLHGVTGFHVESVDEMIKSLGVLLADAPLRLRMGEEARKHVQKFDWDVIAKTWEAAYLEIAAGKEDAARN